MPWWQLAAEAPLFWLTVTLLLYTAANKIFIRTGKKPFFNPVLLSITALVTVLLLADESYDRYFTDVEPLHLLLGPATVALAVPLYALWRKLRFAVWPLLSTLVLGSFLGMFTASLPALWLGFDADIVRSLVPKSVTTPIALGIVDHIGGQPSLTAVLVILTGIFGASFGLDLLTLAGVKNKTARGFVLGIAAHGIATGRAYQADETTGAYAGLAMALNGMVTAGLAPVLVGLLSG